jgi:hypothetical protein
MSGNNVGGTCQIRDLMTLTANSGEPLLKVGKKVRSYH